MLNSFVDSFYWWLRKNVSANVVLSTREQPTGYVFEMIIYFIYMVPVSHRSPL